MNFLLEIGTEEIPHWMIPGALAQLAKLDLFGAMPTVDATPRRLVVRATGLPDRTPDQEQLVKGPPITAGDKAAAGFAKKQGVDLSAMQKVGDYYELRKQIPGRAVRDLLAESLPASILGIQWPKTMYWGAKGSPRFIRPIRWIVALLGDETIDFEVAGVKSGNLSRGHRVLANTQVKVDYASIEAVLRANSVILSASERRAKIETEARGLGATIDPELLETLTYITEFPAAIKGDFDPAYLELPAEVLTMVMRHHQKYFAVESAPGVLAPHFVAVMNVPADPDGLVKQGNERVLKARFNDARFFWDVDQKKKLADRVEDLSHVTFQAKLGTYLEKTHRVVALVKELGGDEDAQRAALLSKADLTTEMVKEFTDLQGIVGGLYAKHQGEAKEVSDAIYEHYKPLSMEDSIPSTKGGQILALADKLDSLRSFFEIGLVPTGSKDPFALRRAAQGVVKILAEAAFDLHFKDVVRAAFGVTLTLQLSASEIAIAHVYGSDGRLKQATALEEFLTDRISYYFTEIRGFRYDVVDAVLAAGVGPMSYAEKRIVALASVVDTTDFKSLATNFKRIKKILEQANFSQPVAIDFAQLAAPEADLYAAALKVSAEFRAIEDYREALLKIASLRPKVDRFFEEVMVNVPDAYIRNQRLTLLQLLLITFSTIADFSKIVIPGDQK
jgi:glycyl-tRNA synthetase beta chain